MRYYKPGDRIYIFGFSRGAFTARFLARMIEEVGVLSKGNEEMYVLPPRSSSTTGLQQDCSRTAAGLWRDCGRVVGGRIAGWAVG